MGSLLRHHPGGVRERQVRASWHHGAMGPSTSWNLWPRPVARAAVGDAGVYTDWRKWPLGVVSGHLCTLLRRGGRASGRGGAGVYTDWRKWPLGAVLRHLCTLLRREGRASGRGGCRSVHRSEKMGSRRRSGAFVYTVATPDCVGWRERRRREVGVFTEASTHTNPDGSESNQCFFVGEER